VTWVIPLVSCVIGLVFAGVLLNQYRERRRWHQLMWSAGLIMFVLATFGEFYGGAFGWTPFVYKLYYFAGVALPGLLGAGTVYLMTRQRPVLGHVYAAATVLVAAAFLVALAGAEINTEALASAGVGSSAADILPVSARRPWSVLLSAVGGMVMLLGALYSWLRFKLVYNRQIFLGALVFILGGTLTSRLGIEGAIPISNLIGVALVFSGVMAAERSRPQATAARAG